LTESLPPPLPPLNPSSCIKPAQQRPRPAGRWRVGPRACWCGGLSGGLGGGLSGGRQQHPQCNDSLTSPQRRSEKLARLPHRVALIATAQGLLLKVRGNEGAAGGAVWAAQAPAGHDVTATEPRDALRRQADEAYRQIKRAYSQIKNRSEKQAREAQRIPALLRPAAQPSPHPRDAQRLRPHPFTATHGRGPGCLHGNATTGLLSEAAMSPATAPIKAPTYTFVGQIPGYSTPRFHKGDHRAADLRPYRLHHQLLVLDSRSNRILGGLHAARGRINGIWH
jgi:hypothetical protein